MNQTLHLPVEVYRKLAAGAAGRGMTVEALLTAVSELLALPDQPTDEDRQRRDRMDVLLDRFRAGKLSAADRQTLEQLIDADFQAATERADRLIRAEMHRSRHPRSPAKAGK